MDNNRQNVINNLCGKDSSDLFGLVTIKSFNPDELRILRRTAILIIIGNAMVLYAIIDALMTQYRIGVFIGIYNLAVYGCAWKAITQRNKSSASWFGYCGFFSWLSMLIILVRGINMYKNGQYTIIIISNVTLESIILIGLTWNIKQLNKLHYFEPELELAAFDEDINI